MLGSRQDTYPKLSSLVVVGTSLINVMVYYQRTLQHTRKIFEMSPTRAPNYVEATRTSKGPKRMDHIPNTLGCSPFVWVLWSRVQVAPTVDDRNPSWPYLDIIYQNHRGSGSIAHIYINKVTQDCYHQQYQRRTPRMELTSKCHQQCLLIGCDAVCVLRPSLPWSVSRLPLAVSVKWGNLFLGCPGVSLQ